MDIETLNKIATRFESLRKFTATRRVNSEAVWLDCRICMPGDRVEVERWHCYMGPTSLTVNGRPHCIPFEWVMEMGAPAELSQYMPFAPQTWPEILAQLTAPKARE